MPVIPAAWSDLGYRRTRGLPLEGPVFSAERIAQFFENYAGYRREAAEWVRLPGRAAGDAVPRYVSIGAVVTAATRADEASYRWSRTFLASKYGQAARGHLPQASPEVCANLVQTILDEEVPKYQSMVNLGKAIGFIAPDQLAMFLRDVVFPTFFAKYPGGQVAVVLTDEKTETQAGLLRSLYSMAYTAPADLKNVGRFHALQKWHEVSGHSTVRTVLELFGYLMYPAVTTYRCGTLGLDLVFIFEPTEEHRFPVFPGDWLALLRSRSTFGEEDRDGLQAIVDPRGAEGVAVAHRRLVHDRRFSADEVMEFLAWWVDGLNILLVESLDPANFTDGHDPSEPIDPVSALENHLTVSRLLKRTAASMSVAEGSQSKGVVFEIADLLDGLMHRNRGVNETAHFQRLFHPAEGLALVSAALDPIPEPFRTYFRDVAQRVYGDLRAIILGSIWVPDKHVGAQVLVKNRELTHENPVPEDEFVARSFRAYRNVHHGYFTAEDRQRRPSRFLYMLNGNTPDSMSDLAPLWLLSYLADPAAIAGTRTLGVQVHG